MDNIVKLPASQALFNATNKLVDLVIPGNSGVYNLSESYVAIDLAAQGIEFDTGQASAGRLEQAGAFLPATSAVADMRPLLKHNATKETIYDMCAVPVEALVRNCSMFTASRGKIEDIRRADVLRATMKAYTQDIEDVETAALGGFAAMAKDSPWAAGRLAVLVGVGDTASEYKNHELRIMLKDLFNIGVSEEWDSSVYGDTRIHLELNLDRLKLVQVADGSITTASSMWTHYKHNQNVNMVVIGGADISLSQPNNKRYKDALPLTFAPVGGTNVVTNMDTIEMQATYDSLDQSPFYVNQMLFVKTTYTQTGNTGVGARYPADQAENYAVVKSISWSPTTKRITLGFGAGSEVLKITAPIQTNALLVNRQVCNINPTAASKAAAEAGLVQSVELTAVRRPDVSSGPDQTQYTQFITQSDQWQNSSQLNRSYYLPPQTTNAFIMLPSQSNQGAEPTAFSDILGCARLGDYRFTLNGESVTNRPVPFLPVPGPLTTDNDDKNGRGSSLHYTAISETMMNSGRRYHSLNESVYDQKIPNSIDIPIDGTTGEPGWPALKDAPNKLCFMLALPVPISNSQTMLTIELNGNFPASSGEIHIFSEIRSVA
jgi:hypothetical protein